MNNDTYNTNLQNTIDDFNSEIEKQEKKDKVMKAAGIIGGAVAVGAGVAIAAEEYDKTNRVNAMAADLAKEQETSETPNSEPENVEENIIVNQSVHITENTPHIHHQSSHGSSVETISHEEFEYHEESASVVNTSTSETVPVQPVEEVPDDFKVEVISVKHDVDVAGHNMDMALVSINDEPTVFVDVDQNGVADILAADNNMNGQFEDNEFYDIREGNLPMPDDPNPTMSSAPDIPDYSSNDDITLVEL